MMPVAAEFQRQGTIAGEATARPWLALHQHLSDTACGDTVEVYNAILLDVYPDIVDEYADAFMGEERQPADPAMSMGELDAHIRDHYDWVINEPESPESEHYFWYRAEAAPFDLRRGVKGVAPDLESETPMDTVRLVRELRSEIRKHRADAPILDMLYPPGTPATTVASPIPRAGSKVGERAHLVARPRRLRGPRRGRQRPREEERHHAHPPPDPFAHLAIP